MDEINVGFNSQVYEIVSSIPFGKVMSYGQIAVAAGSPRAARVVGGIAHYGDPGMPWQRVVRKDGGLAVGYYGGVYGHQKDLESEGVTIINGRVLMDKHQWFPVVAPLLVIVGPTASGKTALAIQIAEKFDGEIICADSRTVYRNMDIGTAKPTKKEQLAVTHHLIDIVDPDQAFTVVDFKRLANDSINDVVRRGKFPIMVGGSGMYVDSVIYDYQFSPGSYDRNPVNPRHLNITEKAETTLRENILIIGLDPGLEKLKERITLRIEDMVTRGLIKEVEDLFTKYPEDLKSLQTPGYKAFREYINNRIDIDVAKAEFIRNDYLLARRQRTWFKRNKSIHWNINSDEIVERVTTLMNKKD